MSAEKKNNSKQISSVLSNIEKKLENLEENVDKLVNTNTRVESIEKSEDIGKKLDELSKEIKMMVNEILFKVNNLEIKSKTSGPRKTDNKLNNTSLTETIPANSLYWFRREWSKNKEEMMSNYCNEKMIKDLNEHMAEDTYSKLQGEAKLSEESKYIWNTYVKPDDCKSLKNKIKSAYDQYVENYKKQNMTPVSKTSSLKKSENKNT